jgi:hypothetical protein
MAVTCSPLLPNNGVFCPSGVKLNVLSSVRLDVLCGVEYMHRSLQMHIRKGQTHLLVREDVT